MSMVSAGSPMSWDPRGVAVPQASNMSVEEDGRSERGRVVVAIAERVVGG